MTISSSNEADQLICTLGLWGIEYLVGEHVPISLSDSARNQQAAITLSSVWHNANTHGYASSSLYGNASIALIPLVSTNTLRAQREEDREQ